MDYLGILEHINSWLLDRLESSKCSGFVVGVSGGIDSALTSTLASMTGASVVCLNLPIRQELSQYDRSNEHLDWLVSRYSNVSSEVLNLSEPLAGFEYSLGKTSISPLAWANLRSRLRMCALYAVANTHNHLVVGTGNKVEDYGIGFFTKYGDGGVDISPIADLLKTEVYSLSRHLGISKSILDAIPTDGLWGDDRGDEDQIGASYEELEWALKFVDMKESKIDMNIEITDRKREVFKIYMDRHLGTKHKMELPPTCYIPSKLK